MPPSAVRPRPPAPPPLWAPERLVALRDCELLDSPPEEAFDRLTRLAARLLRAPMALISLIEPHRQFFKSTAGVPASMAREVEPPHPFCQHVVAHETALVVNDARHDPLVQGSPIIDSLGVASYLGVPLRSPGGQVLGALCVADGTPRLWGADDQRALEDLARLFTDELRLRTTASQLAHERRSSADAHALTIAASDAISDVFCVLDTAGRVLQCNRRLQTVTGHTDAELSAMRAEDFVADEDRTRIRETLEAVLREGAATVEVRVQTKRGRKIPYEFNGRLLRNAAGRVVGVCGTGRDVSERRAAERALREREARFRSLVEATAQVVFTADASGAVTELSSAWSTFTGQTPDEIHGWGWADALHPADRPRIERAWDVHVAARAPYEDVFRVRRHDGAYHWFCSRATPVFAEDGTFVEWVGTCTDVQEQKHAVEELRTSEERLRIALDAAQMGMWDLDLHTQTVTWSPQTMALFGTAPDAFDGRLATAHALIHEADRNRIVAETEAAIGAAATTGQPRALTLEYRALRDGAIRWFRSTGRVFVGDDGAPTRVAGTVRDVTDERAYEQALVEAKERAEEVARMKSTFLSNMSHEIRTPLTTVLGFADLLAASAAGPQVEIVEMIREGGRRLLTTLNSVLELARLESGNATLDLQRRDVASEVAQTARLFEREADAKELTLTYEGPTEGVGAVVDVGGLQRVLTNLLSNAIKFTDRGGHVTARVEPRGEEVAVVIEDTGVGMDEGFLQKAFEPFYQESAGLDRNHEGCGLGLTLVYRLVSLMRGRVEMESAKGKGTSFRVWLPAQEAPADHA